MPDDNPDTLGLPDLGFLLATDLAVVDLSAPHLVPSYDACSTLVYAAGRSDVRQVLARGRRIVADGRLVAGISRELNAVRRVAARIAASLHGGS